MVRVGRIFISYRREDTGDYTARLFAALAAEFGPDALFWDNESIRKGIDDWPSRIDEELERALAIVAVIGPRWATLERDGVRRIDCEDDWVRKEIRSGFARNVQVIPVALKIESLPLASLVPEDIRRLISTQAIEVRSDYLSADCATLIRSLRECVPTLSPSARPEHPRTQHRRQKTTLAGIALLLGGAAVLSFDVWQDQPPPLSADASIRFLYELVEVTRIPFLPERGVRDNLVVRVRVRSLEQTPVRLSGERILDLSRDGAALGRFTNRSDPVVLDPDHAIELFWDLLVPVEVLRDLPHANASLTILTDPLMERPGPSLKIAPISLEPTMTHAGFPSDDQ